MQRDKVKEEILETPSVPPGFASLTSFTLKRIDDSMEAAVASGSQPTSDDREFMRSLRHRPWINYGEFNSSSDEESDSEKLVQNLHPEALPKGVLRGCPECMSCQKVIAKWRPEDACRPTLDESPVFYPTEEEFEDALKYIASIRSKAEKYGICRIVPPPSWDPPCLLKEKSMWDNSKFCTRVQRVDRLQNRYSMRKITQFRQNLKTKRRKIGVESGIDNRDITESNELEYAKENVCFGFEPGAEFTLEAFQKYADDFKRNYFREDSCNGSVGNHSMQPSHSEPLVEDIEGEYWRIIEKPTEEMEVLYGADVDTGAFGSGFPKVSTPTENNCVEKYLKSSWNLNNIPSHPGSMLAFESCNISGVLVPWLYIGMCFSSFCWHVEDHHLYSLNYLHCGAPKFWYGVPSSDAPKLEMAMRKHLPDLFKEQPDLLHKLVTQLSPSILINEGIPVYRCIQNPREFVLTFPRAYHSGFNCGFNCAEAVNVAPLDWLPHGQIAVELYRDQGRKTTFSHDKLLLGVAREAVKAQWEFQLLRKKTSENIRWKEVCVKDGILAKALKVRLEMELIRREYLCTPHVVKMDNSFNTSSERECIICFYDLHLSAVGCPCCPEKFACLIHAKQLCQCPWSEKTLYFRYQISELNILVEALEGKLSAVHKWAKLDLGLTLSSHVSKDKSACVPVSTQSNFSGIKQEFGLLDAAFPASIRSNTRLDREIKSTAVPVSSLSTQKKKENPEPMVLDSTRTATEASRLQDKRSKYRNGFHLTDIPSDKNKSATQSFQIKLGDLLTPPSDSQMCLRSQEDFSAPQTGTFIEQKSIGDSSSLQKVPLRKSVSVKPISNKPISLENDNIIVLSDDEDEEPCRCSPDRATREFLEKSTDVPAKVENYDSKAVPYNHKVQVGVTQKSNMTVVNKDEINALPNVEMRYLPFHPAEQKFEYNRTGDNPMSNKFMLPSNTKVGSVVKPNNKSNDEKNLDSYHQKGPHIAKFVSGMKYDVELLEPGVVLSGKLWSSSQVIFPKGFKSRVSYISVLDPSEMCLYVSEILDAGLGGPLFMVKVEKFPSEVFIHTSITRCWDMVRDRVNREIVRQHNLKGPNRPSLQPPGTIDGLEMFGFSSPAIIKHIEAFDPNRVCTEYWKSRSRAEDFLHPLRKYPLKKQETSTLGNHQPSSVKSDVLKGLFRKANPEELCSLYSALSDDEHAADRGLVTRLLNEEIQKRMM